MLTATYLRRKFRYSKVTGQFYRRQAVGVFLVGSVAGTTRKDGYVLIHVLGRQYLAHRLAWLYAYGEWPEVGLDHIDGQPSNNRLDNLRLASDSQNQQNLKRAKSHNKSGFLGVRKTPSGTYGAQICVAGEYRAKEGYSTPEEAHQVYLRWKAEMHPYQTLVMEK